MYTAPTKTLATLDLTRQSERDACDLIRHMHSGRWPTWRMLAIRRAGGALIELAKWRRGGYVVLEWSLSEIRVTWKDQPSLAEAKRVFKARCGGPLSGPPALVTASACDLAAAC
jgi:hypothetical protein